MRSPAWENAPISVRVLASVLLTAEIPFRLQGLILSPRETTAGLKGTLDRSCIRYRFHAAQPPTSSRSSAKLSRSQSQWSGGALTGTRAYGASEDSTSLSLRPKDRTHASIIFFESKLGLYQQSLTAHSILEHDRSVHLHGKPSIIFSSGSSMETHRFLYE